MGLFKDISNYVFIRRKLRKARKTETWEKLGLDYDWVGRVWTVINLRQEDVGEETLVKKARVIEKIKPINTFLYEQEIGEIIIPAVEPKTERSYLIVYYPKFEYLTTWRAIKILVITAGSIWAIIGFSLIEKILSLF